MLFTNDYNTVKLGIKALNPKLRRYKVFFKDRTFPFVYKGARVQHSNYLENMYLVSKWKYVI